LTSEYLDPKYANLYTKNLYNLNDTERPLDPTELLNPFDSYIFNYYIESKVVINCENKFPEPLEIKYPDHSIESITRAIKTLIKYDEKYSNNYFIRYYMCNQNNEYEEGMEEDDTEKPYYLKFDEIENIGCFVAYLHKI
jgi:hypothetical protein